MSVYGAEACGENLGMGSDGIKKSSEPWDEI